MVNMKPLHFFFWSEIVAVTQNSGKRFNMIAVGQPHLDWEICLFADNSRY